MRLLEYYLLDNFAEELENNLKSTQRIYSIVKQDVYYNVLTLQQDYNDVGKTFENKQTFEDLYLDEFQKKVFDKKMEEYDFLCESMQKLYARFENQIVQYRNFVKSLPEEIRPKQNIDFSMYPIVKQTKNAVNVMKHNIGLSFYELKKDNSKFLETPVLFEGYPTYYTSDVVLNVEYDDLRKFVDSAKEVWKNKAQEYTEVKENAKKSKSSTVSESKAVKTKSEKTKDVSTK